MLGSEYPTFHQNPKSMVNSGEMGRSGLRYYLPGWISRDFLPELSGRNLWLVLQEMGDNDATCGAALNAYGMFIRKSEWSVQPASKKTEDQEAAEFLESCMSDMQHSWKTMIATASKAVPQFGFAPFEKIFKVRAGYNTDPRYSSKFDDGAVGWSNISIRSPDTVLHWDYDPEDVTRLLGLTQLAAPDWRQTFIPLEKLVIFRAEPGKDNPEGRSILRSAYRAWRTKKIMEDLRNIIIERGGAGIPHAEVPSNIANANQLYGENPTGPDAIEALAAYDSLVETLENITQDKQKWIITPQLWDKEGRPQIKVDFLQPSMGADIVGHITEAIRTEANAILQSTMTEFLSLGTGPTGGGSLALSRDKTDNFTLSIIAYLDAFESSVESQLVAQLFRLNPQFEDLDELPKIIHEPVVPLSASDTAMIIGLFEKAGWSLQNQNGIRDAILGAIGLPDYEDKTALESDQTPATGDSPKSEAIQQILEARSDTKKSARKARHQKSREARRAAVLEAA